MAIALELWLTRTRTRIATTIAIKADVSQYVLYMHSANLITASASNRNLPYQLDKNAILTDLTSEKPQWILSAYGPGRHAPAQLFGGPSREISFEEMRLAHYMGMAAGNAQQVAQEADTMYQNAEQQMQNAVSNIDQAIQYLINAEKDHPNRVDICKAGSEGPGARPNPLGGNTAFGAPSNSGNAFGAPSQPAFGASSQPSTFGAPSVSTGAFGQPSQLGSKPNPFASSGSAFGAPSQLGATGAFGQSAQLGQKPNPFGAPPSGSGFSAFAGPAKSAFGQPSNPTPAFGESSQPATTNAFGAPSQPATSSPFGAAPSQAPANPFAQKAPAPSNPFGAPSQPTQQNPFGTGAFFGAPSQPANAPAFGQPTLPAPTTAFGTSQPTPAFGQPTVSGPAPTNPFGAPQPASAFGQPTQPAPANTSLFGGNQPPSAPSTFSNPPPTGPSASSGNPFGATQSSNGLANGNSSNQQPVGDLNSYSTRDQNGRLTSWKNQRIVYKEDVPGYTNQAGKWERIWFPNGHTPDSQAFLPADKYDQDTRDRYAYVMQNGEFKDGIMPLLPPLMEMCRWDF